MNWEGLAFDLWIELLPDSIYDLCPCGCGQKVKFAFRAYDKHEQEFIRKQLNLIRDEIYS